MVSAEEKNPECVMLTGTLHHNGDNQTIHERIFSIDYSKRGTAKCGKCNKAITKGEIRIGKSMKFKVGYISHYFHLDCIFKSFQRAKSTATIIKDINDINGIESIKHHKKNYKLKS